MGTRKPLVETKRKLKLGYGNRYLAQLQKPEIWKNIIKKVEIIEACHGGGPVAKWTCPWCKTEVMQAYEGNLMIHFCPQCVRATRLSVDGYVFAERLPSKERKKIPGMTAPSPKRVRNYRKRSYRKGPCRICLAAPVEEHRETCSYRRKKI